MNRDAPVTKRASRSEARKMTAPTMSSGRPFKGIRAIRLSEELRIRDVLSAQIPFDQASSHSVHPDSVGRQFQGRLLGQHLDSGLRHTVSEVRCGKRFDGVAVATRSTVPVSFTDQNRGSVTLKGRDPKLKSKSSSAHKAVCLHLARAFEEPESNRELFSPDAVHASP